MILNPSIKQYFILQYIMSNRKLRDLGLNPLLGYILFPFVFIVLSEFMFLKTDFAKYIMMLVAWFLAFRVSESNRLDFLTITFTEKISKQIRIIENVLLSIPFSIVLAYHHAYKEAILLVLGSVLASNSSLKSSIIYTIPTPFYKYPFEFIVGFRNIFYIFPIIYLITIIALSVQNFNLGLFSLLLVYLISLSYYLKPEHEYYVWSYASNPARFLAKKISVAGLYSLLLALPIVILLLISFKSEWQIILLSLPLGIVLLTIIILAKYSVYPKEMNLPEGVLLAICLYLPWLLLLIGPYFYFKSIRKLNFYLK